MMTRRHPSRKSRLAVIPSFTTVGYLPLTSPCTTTPLFLLVSKSTTAENPGSWGNGDKPPRAPRVVMKIISATDCSLFFSRPRHHQSTQVHVRFVIRRIITLADKSRLACQVARVRCSLGNEMTLSIGIQSVRHMEKRAPVFTFTWSREKRFNFDFRIAPGSAFSDKCARTSVVTNFLVYLSLSRAALLGAFSTRTRV